MNSIISVLEKESADVLILTEYRNNKVSELLKSSLKDFGYNYQYTIDTEPRVNSVLIATKIEFLSETFEELGEHRNRVIKLQNSVYTIFGCYFPLNKHKKKVFEFLLAQIEKNKDQNIIIAGDYNTGKHYIDEKGATFFHSNYLEEFENKGLFDVWRELNPTKKEFSWYSNAGNGFRLDHFFIQEKLKDNVIDCYYKHSYREDNFSDHSLMTLELKDKNDSTKKRILKKEKTVSFRNKFPANLRTNDGHFVRSRAEVIIDNTLYNYRLAHAYERKLPIKENVYSDFYIPQKNGSEAVYIEFWGLENDPKYSERKKIKKNIYKKYNLNLIEIADNHIENLDDHLPRMLLKFGIKVE